MFPHDCLPMLSLIGASPAMPLASLEHPLEHLTTRWEHGAVPEKHGVDAMRLRG